jgi:hypothetical protein
MCGTQDPTIFNDVVQGDNTCTEDACPCPAGDGFYAAPGKLSVGSTRC